MNNTAQLPRMTLMITVPLGEDEADAFAEFLKRAGHSDYRQHATSDQQAYQMLHAGETIRKALNEQQ